jgi:hypothetical protein
MQKCSKKTNFGCSPTQKFEMKKMQSSIATSLYLGRIWALSTSPSNPSIFPFCPQPFAPKNRPIPSHFPPIALLLPFSRRSPAAARASRRGFLASPFPPANSPLFAYILPFLPYFRLWRLKANVIVGNGHSQNGTQNGMNWRK